MSFKFSGSGAKYHAYHSAEKSSNDFSTSRKPGKSLNAKTLFQHAVGNQSFGGGKKVKCVHMFYSSYGFRKKNEKIIILYSGVALS